MAEAFVLEFKIMNPKENGLPQEKPPELDEYQLFRQRKHETFNTPPEVISRLIERAVHAPISAKERIINGETNEVYAVTAAGRELIVRIHHGPKNRFAKEAWIFKQCAAIGIPVPEMLLVDELDLEGKPAKVCVETKMEGVGMDKMPQLREPGRQADLIKLLNQLGKILKKLHSIRIEGFGPIELDRTSRYKTVRDLITKDDKINRELLAKGLEGNEAARNLLQTAYRVLESEAAKHGETSSSLLHNDLSPSHIIVKDGNVSGLIDFESACAGDPIMEFALWDFKLNSDYPTKYIMDGYGTLDTFSREFASEMSFWKVFRALHSLAYCLQEKKKAGTDRALKAIREGLEGLSA